MAGASVGAGASVAAGGSVAAGASVSTGAAVGAGAQAAKNMAATSNQPMNRQIIFFISRSLFRGDCVNETVVGEWKGISLAARLLVSNSMRPCLPIMGKRC